MNRAMRRTPFGNAKGARRVTQRLTDDRPLLSRDLPRQDKGQDVTERARGREGHALRAEGRGPKGEGPATVGRDLGPMNGHAERLRAAVFLAAVFFAVLALVVVVLAVLVLLAVFLAVPVDFL